MVKFAVATVNGNKVSLREALSLALWRDNLGFVEEVIDARIISDAAAQLGISVSLGELQEGADAFRATHELHKASAMNEWLAERGRTIEQWQDYLEQGVLAGKLRDSLFDKKVEQYFAENKPDFDRAVISRIVLTEESVAQELWYRIFDDGDDFYALARKYSSDNVTRPSGGIVAPVARGDLPPAVRAAVFAAHAGEIIGPIAVKEGWLLVKVEEHLPAFLDTEVRERIKARLFKDWLAQQRDRGQVKRHLSEWI
jgi:putative peptide maturation system protein